MNLIGLYIFFLLNLLGLSHLVIIGIEMINIIVWTLQFFLFVNIYW